MKIQSYLASLLPSFSRDRVTEDCRITRGEIKEYVIPAYDSGAAFFKGRKIKSKELASMYGSFRALVKGEGNDDPITTIHKNLKVMLANLDEAEEKINAVYSEEIAGGGFTYLKANLLQFVECVNFVSRYSLKFLDYAYICETAEYEEGGTAIADSLRPAEIEWLEAHVIHFCTAFNAVTGNVQNVKKALADIPDIVITPENAETLPQTMGRKIDPLHMGLIPVWLNPIYHVGMLVAEWQASRHKEAKAQLQLLQLRKLNLETTSQGKPSATVQKQIASLESRIKDLRYDIAKMEGNVKHG
jgi:hypothetical protein